MTGAASTFLQRRKSFPGDPESRTDHQAPYRMEELKYVYNKATDTWQCQRCRAEGLISMEGAGIRGLTVTKSKVERAKRHIREVHPAALTDDSQTTESAVQCKGRINVIAKTF